MNPTVNPLEGLRDLHVPDPISFWPLAFGWWMIALFVLILAGIGVWGLRHRKKTAPRRIALAELTALKAEFYERQDIPHLMRSLSQLLRRYAIACFGRQSVAGLTGDSWLRFLDEQGKTNQFSSELGQQAFVAIPYGAQVTVNEGDILTLVERWIKSIPLSSRKLST